ncbi:MAG: ParB/RepB/Spo0J family partition protein [Planctomycetes bacterium]|nr:ParB/RepB/Spo0J family partition protein [Planctomycetota bacterium]
MKYIGGFLIMNKRKSFSINKNLTAGLTQTVASVKAHAFELRYEVIPISQIELDPENPREISLSFCDFPQGPSKDDPLYAKKILEIDSLESLKNSIQKEGVLNAVIVYKHQDKYRLVAGERRCLASLLSDKKDIYARILDKKPEQLRKGFLQWIENSERTDLSLWERIRNIRKIIDGYLSEVNEKAKVNGAFLSDLLGCSSQTASNYFAVLNAADPIKKAIQDGKVNNLDKAALVAKIPSENIQDKALIACVNGEPIKGLKALVASLEKQKETLSREKQNPSKSGVGRKASRVSLGYTNKPIVVKTIVNVFTQHKKYEHFKDHFGKYDMTDYSGASKAFGLLVELLESE